MNNNHQSSLVDKINAILPQTQCTRCGYPSCLDYAKAIDDGSANINQCPPGGNDGIVQLAILLNKPILPLNPTNGIIKPQQVAVINEEECIGCTLCIKACPVEAIIGSNKMMHTVITDHCTGCDLCIAPCPVDCIDMVDREESTWGKLDRDLAKMHYDKHNARKEREIEARELRLHQYSITNTLK